MKKSYSDIDFFTKPNTPSFMSDNLVFLSEDHESFEKMFMDKVNIFFYQFLFFIFQDFISIYKKIEPFLDIIYFTDRQTYTKEKYAIFFSFDINVSTPKMTEVFRDLTFFVHCFIDLVSSLKVPSNVNNLINNFYFIFQHKNRADKNRVEFDKLRAKELQERNAEVNFYSLN